MTGGMSSRTCYTKLNFDYPYVRSLSLRRAPYMVANLVKIKCHVFLDLNYYFHHFCSHVIGTFQERAVNDELNRS